MQIVVAQMPLGNEDEDDDEYRRAEERCIPLVLVLLLVLDDGIFAIASIQIWSWTGGKLAMIAEIII